MFNSPKKLRNLMKLTSQVRYAIWRISKSNKSIILQLNNGLNISLRPIPNSDLETAYEIFVSEVYNHSSKFKNGDINNIVDIGSNVGYSVLYFSKLFPNANLEAFEPHPENFLQLHHHVRLNNLEDRIKLHKLAASNYNGNMFLTDQQTHSQIVNHESNQTIRTEVFDWLSIAKDKKIDLLKMDIEGGEYSIIFDERFADLDIRNFVIEWHINSDNSISEKELFTRLQGLNYNLEEGFRGKIPNLEFGIVWGRRQT